MIKVKRRGHRGKSRQGIAVVEFALCAPILLLLGFGFISCGLMIQMRHNSKIIGHMAATDIFKTSLRDADAILEIETRYEQMALGLGIAGLDVAITETNGFAVVTTTMPVDENSPLPVNFQFTDSIQSETHVYAPFQ